jgi:hypothetical protein
MAVSAVKEVETLARSYPARVVSSTFKTSR